MELIRISNLESLNWDTITTTNRSTPMSHSDTIREALLKTEYDPVSSPRKLNLLLQRSVRYSYRQRCCKCCPTILCELVFPIVLIILLILSRYGINRLAEEINNNDGTLPGTFNQHPCSQNMNTPPTSSNDIFAKCFKFPPSYGGGIFSGFDPTDVSNATNIIFEPDRADIKELVQLAATRLAAMKCDNAKVW